MRMYSPEELDVMAEAYDLVRKRLPHDSSVEATQRVVQEIAWAVANGIRDEEVVANAAVERAIQDAA